ncbi:MAG: hypothetical protein RR202_02420 [Bacteroidales bacterium]
MSLHNHQDSIVLQREKPLSIHDFEGKYFLSPISEENNGFTQYVDIRSDNQERPNVWFASSDAKGETIFSARGHIINNQIEIALSEINKNMNSTMVIRFVGDNLLEVSTADFDNRYDLNYFCRGGGSLAGEYIKQK